jgi:hypothetical protein
MVLMARGGVNPPLSDQVETFLRQRRAVFSVAGAPSCGADLGSPSRVLVTLGRGGSSNPEGRAEFTDQHVALRSLRH